MAVSRSIVKCLFLFKADGPGCNSSLIPLCCLICINKYREACMYQAIETYHFSPNLSRFHTIVKLFNIIQPRYSIPLSYKKQSILSGIIELSLQNPRLLPRQVPV